MLLGRRDDQGPRVRLGIPGLAHPKQHRPAADIMPTRRRNPRHRPAVGLKPQWHHARQPGHLIHPSPGGIDQHCPAELSRRTGNGPTSTRADNTRHPGLGHDPRALAAGGLGKALQQQVGVDIPGMVRPGRTRHHSGVQDRHHCAGLVAGNQGQVHMIGIGPQMRHLLDPGNGKQPPWRQNTLLGKEIRARRQRQAHHRGCPIMRFIQRRRPPRSVMGQVILRLQQQHRPQFRQPRRHRNPGNAAANDDEIRVQFWLLMYHGQACPTQRRATTERVTLARFTIMYIHMSNSFALLGLLADPLRLKIVKSLRQGERAESDIVVRVGIQQSGV